MQLPFFRSILILFPPFLLVRFGRPGITGLLATRGLWLRTLGVGEVLVVLVWGASAVGETLSCESCPDWSANGGIVASGSGVLERTSGCLTSSLVLSLSPLGSGWGFALARTNMGLFVLAERSLPSPVKSWPIKPFSYRVLLATERISNCTDGVAIAWRNTSCDLGGKKSVEQIALKKSSKLHQAKLNKSALWNYETAKKQSSWGCQAEWKWRTAGRQWTCFLLLLFSYILIWTEHCPAGLGHFSPYQMGRCFSGHLL